MDIKTSGTPFAGPGEDFDYFSIPALNASLAKLLVRSAAHGKYYLDNPPKPSAAMQLGTAVHALILEPEKTAFVVKRLNWTTKEGKAEREELQAYGLPILSQDEADAAYRIRDNVLAITDIASALADGKTEVPAFWDGRGVSCKAKADLVTGDTIFDVKTCQDASPRGFLSSVWKYRYMTQAAHYLDGFSAKQFIFIAVETEAPFTVGLYDLGSDLLGQGNRDLDIAAARYQHGITTGEWPGYDTSRITTLGEVQSWD